MITRKKQQQMRNSIRVFLPNRGSSVLFWNFSRRIRENRDGTSGMLTIHMDICCGQTEIRLKNTMPCTSAVQGIRRVRISGHADEKLDKMRPAREGNHLVFIRKTSTRHADVPGDRIH